MVSNQGKSGDFHESLNLKDRSAIQKKERQRLREEDRLPVRRIYFKDYIQKNSPAKTVNLIGSIWSNLSPMAMPMTIEKLETTGPDDQLFPVSMVECLGKHPKKEGRIDLVSRFDMQSIMAPGT